MSDGANKKPHKTDEIKRTNAFMLLNLIYMICANVIMSAVLSKLKTAPPDYIILIMTEIVMQLIPFAVYLSVTRKKIADVLSFKNPGVKNILFVVGMALCVQPVMMLISAFSSLFYVNSVSEKVSGMYGGVFQTAVSILIISIVPAFFEEFVYRGVVFSGYKSAPIIAAAVVNGLFFGIMHVNPQQFLYAFALGAVFSFVLYYSKSIITTMIFHFTVNAFQSLLLAFAGPASNSAGTAAATAVSTMDVIRFLGYVSIVFIPLFALLYYKFVKYNRQSRQSRPITQGGECFSYKSVLSAPFFGVILLYILAMYIFY